jgi:hypothetical protein
MKAPRRYKSIEELTTEEHFERVGARLRGEATPPKVETAEYKEHRRRALRAAGMGDEADALEDRPDPESWTVEDHVEH